MKALTVDFDLIIQSMRDLSRESTEYYFNKTSGEVFALSRALLKSLSEERSRDEASVPNWDSNMIPVAREIVLKGAKDYIRIPEAFGRPQHKWMLEFAKDIRGTKLKSNLIGALRGRGACSRFKDILKEFPDELRRWTMFNSGRWKERIQEWLESQDVLAVDKNPRKPRATAR